MDREIPVKAEWAHAWLARTYHPLQCETLLVCYALSLTSLFVGIRALINMRRARRAIENDPSNRAAIFAESNKRLHKTTRAQYYMTLVYLINAMAIWLVDAGIGIAVVKEDVTSNPEHYDVHVWLDLAIRAISMLAIFSSVFIIFPMLQMMGVAFLLGKFHRGSNEGTIAAYIPEARIITTQLSYLWMMVGFMIVSFWPVFDNSLVRILILEASFGSAMAWLHASFAFNFRADTLSAVEVEPLLNVRDGVKFYGKQVYAVALGSPNSSALPQYEAVAQDEKTGL